MVQKPLFSVLHKDIRRLHPDAVGHSCHITGIVANHLSATTIAIVIDVVVDKLRDCHHSRARTPGWRRQCDSHLRRSNPQTRIQRRALSSIQPVSHRTNQPTSQPTIHPASQPTTSNDAKVATQSAMGIDSQCKLQHNIAGGDRAWRHPCGQIRSGALTRIKYFSPAAPDNLP